MKKSRDQWQFGDFQTPDSLARKIVATLKSNHHLHPQTILEPSCGKGAFIRAVLDEFQGAKIRGLDINPTYIEEARLSIAGHPSSARVTLEASDFFETDWNAIWAEPLGPVLIIGNPPWVTNSELSLLQSRNRPQRSNFHHRRGIDAITGSGNFDISEWMILHYVDWLSEQEGTIAVLCKYAIARKVLQQIQHRSATSFSSSIYLIDAHAYFNASVDACLLVLTTDQHTSDCNLYESLESPKPSSIIGARNGWMLGNTSTYETWKHLAGQDGNYVWRSGVKHDCCKIMELERVDADRFQNGAGKTYTLETTCLYPLLKSSDLNRGETQTYRKLIVITQTRVGDDTAIIQQRAPQTWQYLLEHDDHFRKRKSSVYKNQPPYSMFGVGPYTFKDWKIAISGLYKTLNFCLVGPLDGKAVVFDDTVNFLAFDTEAEARFILRLVTSPAALEFLSSMMFWGEKRPITIAILRRLSLQAVAQELGVVEQYLDWVARSGLPARSNPVGVRPG